MRFHVISLGEMFLGKVFVSGLDHEGVELSRAWWRRLGLDRPFKPPPSPFSFGRYDDVPALSSPLSADRIVRTIST